MILDSSARSDLPQQQSAFRYQPVQDLCVITTYFNPSHYQNKRAHYLTFAETMRAASIPFHTIELAFGDDEFEIPEAEDIARVRGTSENFVWPKERLLNRLVRELPRKFRKIAWIDADVLFVNPAWAVQASRALENYRVIQPFERVIRLPRGARDYKVKGGHFRGFAATFSKSPECLRTGVWKDHGHVGFAWAARREVLDTVGFYDGCITGSSDHLMAHAYCGDETSPCVLPAVGHDTKLAAHYRAWSQRAFACVQGSVGFVPGALLHLWHGHPGNRRYREKNDELMAIGFDPESDIELDENRLWRWRAARPELRKWGAGFFSTRHEDG